MQFCYSIILAIFINFGFGNVTLSISDINAEYLEISMINEERIVGFQFQISPSDHSNVTFDLVDTLLYGQELTGYGEQAFVGSEGFAVFGNQEGMIVGFSLNSQNLIYIEPSAPDTLVLLRIPWSFDPSSASGTVTIDNWAFITPGIGGGPPQYTEVSFPGGGVELANYGMNIPLDFELSQAYPNPFNPETRIDFALPKQSNISISVFDINGRKIKSLIESNKIPGFYSVTWNGLDDNDRDVSSGMYIYQMVGNDFVLSGKMMLLK